MRGGLDQICGCFPVGRHYPGIAEELARIAVVIEGLAMEFDAKVPWQDLPIVLIDTETTGLDPENDRVIEIGLVCFVRGEITLTRNWLVNPGIPVSEESRAIHGITEAELATAPPFAAIALEVVETLRGRVPVAYNAEFDRAFVRREVQRTLPSLRDLPPALREDVSWIDPLVWAREIDKYEESRKLAAVAERLGVKVERSHRAAEDAEVAGRVLFALRENLPATYGELIRLQNQYASRQEVDQALRYPKR